MRPYSASFDIRTGKRSIRVAALLVLAAISTALACGCGGEQAPERTAQRPIVTQFGLALPKTPAEQSADKTTTSGKPAKARGRSSTTHVSTWWSTA